MDNGIARRYRDHRRTINTFLFLLLLLLFFIIIVFLLFFNTPGSGYKAVKLSGKGTYLNYSKPYGEQFYVSDHQNKSGLLVENGDIIVVKDLLLPFNTKLYDSLYFDHINDSLVLINNKIAALTLTNRGNLLPWLQQMKTRDLDHLAMITVTGAIPETYYSYLEKIARVKPHTAIMFNPDTELAPGDLQRLLKLFSPAVLSVSLTDAQLPVLARCRNVQTLVLSGDTFQKALPPLPSLRQCILAGQGALKIHKDFFSNNPQLETLTTFSAGNLEYSRALPALKELHLAGEGTDTLDLAPLLQNHPNLTALTLSTRCRNISLLSRLKELSWLGLPVNTSQKELNEILSHLSSLEVLELTGSGSVTSLAPVTHLPSLKGLVITDTLTDLPSLLQCNQLNYLSLPDTVYKDQATLAALQKALPGCMIVPNSGACLGSGWLLLVPLLVVLTLFFRSVKTTTYDQKA